MTPYAHQTAAFERFKDKAFGALFLEQGLGKSKIAIDLADHKAVQEEITGVLVVTPKSLIANWAQIEIPKHSATKGLIVSWPTHATFPPDCKLCWFVCNIDAIITDKWVKAFQVFYKTYPNFMLIVDESTTCKTPKIKRTERMMAIAHYAKCRFILSGHPITNSPLDIWQQGEILTPGIWGNSYFLFSRRYAIYKRMVMGMRTFDKLVGFQNLEELSQRVNKFAVIAKKADCLDLPPKIYRKVPVEFTQEQREHYNNLKNLALTQIDDTTIHAVNAVSLINMLLQVCAGQIKKGDKEYQYLETNRIDALSDILDESPEKGLIWCSFVGAADAIEKALGKRIMRIRAEMEAEEKQNILDQYEDAEGTPALLLNQASMGKGITILEGRNMIYYSQRFSVEQRVQSEDRPHRIGQTKSVLVTELYTPGTVEEKVIKVLKDSQDLANKIIMDRSTLREFIE